MPQIINGVKMYESNDPGFTFTVSEVERAEGYGRTEDRALQTALQELSWRKAVRTADAVINMRVESTDLGNGFHVEVIGIPVLRK